MWFDTRQVANLRRPTLFLLDWARRATYAKSLAAEPTRSMTSRVGRQGGPVAQRMRAPMRAVVLLTRVRSHSEARCAYSKELAPVHCSLRICASPFCLPLIGALFCIMTPPPPIAQFQSLVLVTCCALLSVARGRNIVSHCKPLGGGAIVAGSRPIPTRTTCAAPGRTCRRCPAHTHCPVFDSSHILRGCSAGAWGRPPRAIHAGCLTTRARDLVSLHGRHFGMHGFSHEARLMTAIAIYPRENDPGYVALLFNVQGPVRRRTCCLAVRA